MRIRDRLQTNNLTEKKNLKETQSKESFLLSELFADDDNARKLIVDYAAAKRNIILISKKSYDKFIIADYIKSQLRQTNARIINDISSFNEDLNNRINIIPNPDISNIVKILEEIIYGCRSFVFGVNLGEYTNIIEKLKVLIALNYKNLTSNDINVLIGSANAIVVYIMQKKDGLFYISQIDEMKFNQTQTDLKLDMIFKQEVIETKSEEATTELKLNKYQQLKEKIKQKKAEENE